ncbi:hypothetical protein [Roseomonas elaeocarpi]|uniref:Uncharacterized protein n=1 Tax=Roseomonas elaeocarpi TaxID=907779 RepID=A0ABV6JPE9_9PROT
MTLLLLSDGLCSLEFDTSDIPLVAAAISERYGVPEQRLFATAAEYRFGGCSFAFQNQWDDPCLIAGSSEGSEILKALHELLATT